MTRTALAICLMMACSILAGPAGATAAPTSASAPRTAVFDFEFINTSPAPTAPAELRRTRALSEALRTALANSGRYTIVDTAPVAAALAAGPELRDCNGCEIDYARKLGAKLVAYGWIQKVSDLILNINLVIEDVATGKTVTGASTDIRGNTDESWDRGLKFMLDDRVFDN